MVDTKQVGARAFMKANGFLIGTKPERIDAALLRSLDPVSRRRIEDIWAVRNMGLSSGLEMYEVPQTAKQAALLFSHDWPRAAASMEWFGEIVRRIECRSVAEMGCGAGFLLAYIRTIAPTVEVYGIDAAANLARIAADLTGRSIQTGDYCRAPPHAACDLVLCDFGFDLANFSPSERPHEIAEVGGQPYCRNCSDDLAAQFEPYVRAWRTWATPEAPLAISGRFGNFGVLRALMISARRAGWELAPDLSRVLKTRNIEGTPERFPALIFQPARSGSKIASEEQVAVLFSS